MASSDDTNRVIVGISCTTAASTGESLHVPRRIIRLRLTAYQSETYGNMGDQVFQSYIYLTLFLSLKCVNARPDPKSHISSLSHFPIGSLCDWSIFSLIHLLIG